MLNRFALVCVGSDSSSRKLMDLLSKRELHGQNPIVTPCNKQSLSQFEMQSRKSETRGLVNFLLFVHCSWFKISFRSLRHTVRADVRRGKGWASRRRSQWLPSWQRSRALSGPTWPRWRPLPWASWTWWTSTTLSRYKSIIVDNSGF